MTTLPTPSQSGFHSPLAGPLEQFLTLKRAMGYRYREEALLLRDLDRFLTTHLASADPVLTLELARAYLARRGTESDTTRAHRLTILREVSRFLRLEDGRTAIPGPRFLGIARSRFVARVLTREEGARFLQACATFRYDCRWPLRHIVFATAFRVLYLTGLRTGEIRRLTQADVDLHVGVLHIRDTKFGKSRLIPVAADLVDHLAQCRKAVQAHLRNCTPDTPFFPDANGRSYGKGAFRYPFHQLLDRAGIPRISSGRRLRVHDLRHSFAGLRLALWYEQGADLGAKLPLLATYLGHVDLVSSQRYLQLTQDVVTEITRRHDARFGHLIADERS